MIGDESSMRVVAPGGLKEAFEGLYEYYSDMEDHIRDTKPYIANCVLFAHGLSRTPPDDAKTLAAFKEFRKSLDKIKEKYTEFQSLTSGLYEEKGKE